VALNRFVELGDTDLSTEATFNFRTEATFNFKYLHEIVKKVIRNMNRIIDRNLYTLDEMKNSNLRHRPVGLGVQGMADTFAMMRLPWESKEAQLLNRQIFETMYHAALEASCELAAVHGPYETYKGCPVSRGELQYDMWGVTPTDLWDWATLKASIAVHGVYNSLLLTVMPTASTAQILGNNESIEPFTSNIYTRSVLSGEFQVVNKYLIYDLIELDLWDDKMRDDIIRNYGSVQSIDRIPQHLRDVYKTVWEIPQRVLIDMAADRGAFICQSQSFNLHMRDPTDEQLGSALFYGWEKGLKTCMYYLRTRPAVDPIQFSLEPESAEAAEAARIVMAAACARDNPGACLSCQ
jgi:ribonucleoside-diphosphate reductase subunit M1